MLDAFMSFITNKYNFIPVIVLFILLVIWLEKRRGLVLVAILAITIGINDFFCGQILKPLIGRPRPCNVVDILQSLPYCSGSFSFPSNHASNMFTFATFLSLVYPNSVLLTYAFASTVALSRVYLGVHYPTDVFGGALCGIVMGYFGYQLFLAIQKTPLVNAWFRSCKTPLQKS